MVIIEEKNHQNGNEVQRKLITMVRKGRKMMNRGDKCF